jgi:Rrf2 family protein
MVPKSPIQRGGEFLSGVLRISDAASLALHTAALLACVSRETLTVTRMASILHVSRTHLAKVMQRLSKASLVQGGRGPKGGYRLKKKPDQISLLEVYEAMEGPLVTNNCLLGNPICKGEGCILGDLPHTVDRQVREYLSTTRLADLAGVYGEMDLVED